MISFWKTWDSNKLSIILSLIFFFLFHVVLAIWLLYLVIQDCFEERVGDFWLNVSRNTDFERKTLVFNFNFAKKWRFISSNRKIHLIFLPLTVHSVMVNSKNWHRSYIWAQQEQGKDKKRLKTPIMNGNPRTFTYRRI